jgi:ubiquinone/menaquinone biosynthesis C-methylase UbiE
MPGGAEDIFDPSFVKDVFDRCGPNYRTWSHIASFGFIWIWRRKCIEALPKPDNETPIVFDLMAGTGETWGYLLKQAPHIRKIVAIDISSKMVEYAISRLHKMRAEHIEVHEANVLTENLAPESADIVVCSFGLKTFNKQQQSKIANQVARLLKPGGSFSFVEASDPKGWMLRGVYRFYMCSVLPWIERLFLNGAQDFAMIGAYTAEFQNCGYFAKCLEREGLNVVYRRLFFGCASGVSGSRSILKD